MSSFHDLFKAQLGKTRIDPNKAFSQQLARKIAPILEVPMYTEVTLEASLAPLGNIVALAQRLKKPFDLHEIMKKGFKGQLRDMLDELESMNPDAEYRFGFFGRSGSNMQNMVFTNSDLFISNKFSYVMVPNLESDTSELYLQTVTGFLDNLPRIKK